MGPFPTTARNNRYILVCVDLLTNWVEACALKTITAAKIIQAFLNLSFPDKDVLLRYSPTKVFSLRRKLSKIF
jgi:hypothetical protein